MNMDEVAFHLAHRETLWVTRPGAIARHYRALPPDQQLTVA